MGAQGVKEHETRLKIAASWTRVLFNITFADITGFLYPGTLDKVMSGDVGFRITPESLLGFLMLTEVVPVMVFLVDHAVHRRRCHLPPPFSLQSSSPAWRFALVCLKTACRGATEDWPQGLRFSRWFRLKVHCSGDLINPRRVPLPRCPLQDTHPP